MLLETAESDEGDIDRPKYLERVLRFIPAFLEKSSEGRILKGIRAGPYVGSFFSVMSFRCV